MKYQILIFLFVRTHREGNFVLYVEVVEELVPLFFALDHVNYARWVPVRIKGMRSLPNSIKDEFEKQGHWVLSKTKNKFSTIAFDQVREQETKL